MRRQEQARLLSERGHAGIEVREHAGRALPGRDTRHEALMLRKLMEAGAVKRTGRGRPRIRPAAAAGDKGYSRLSLRRYLRRRASGR